MIIPLILVAGGGAVSWGDISGVLANQVDLQAALNAATNVFIAASAPVEKGFPNLQIDTSGGNLQFWVES
jgi:hypothetical protein